MVKNLNFYYSCKINNFEKRTLKRSVNEVKNDLKDILPDLFKVHEEALKLYEQEIKLTPPSARPRGFEAQVFNAKIVQVAQTVFKEKCRHAKYGRFMIFVQGYIIFFKKLDDKDMPMNVQTLQTEYIRNQTQWKLFPADDNGCSPILFFGYNTSRFGEIYNPKLVCVDEDRVLWRIEQSDIEMKPATPVVSPDVPAAKVSLKQQIKNINKYVND